MSVFRPRVLVVFAAGTLLVAGGCSGSPTAPAAEAVTAAPAYDMMEAESSGYIIAGGRSQP